MQLFFGTYRSNQHAIVFFCVDICRDVFLPAGSHPAESLVGCLLLEELSLLAGCKLLYLWAAFILLFWQTADCDAALSLHFDGAIAKPGPSQAATHGAATLATSIILSPRCVRLEVVTLPCTYNPNPSSQRRNQFLMR